MPQAAYDLKHFAPSRKAEPPRPRVKVATGRRVTARKKQTLRMVRTMLMAMVVVVLVFAVLQTQTRLTELQTDIARQKAELQEQQSLYTHLSFELESKSNMRNIEARAKEMGMIKVDKNQLDYIRVEGGEGIVIRERGLSSVFAGLNTAFSNMWNFLVP